MLEICEVSSENLPQSFNLLLRTKHRYIFLCEHGAPVGSMKPWGCVLSFNAVTRYTYFMLLTLIDGPVEERLQFYQMIQFVLETNR